MKNIYKILTLFLILTFTSCTTIPKILKQDGKNFGIKEWSGGKIYYVDYIFKGGSFKEVENILAAVLEITRSRGMNETVVGRYPSPKEWQFGFISQKDFNENTIAGYPVRSMDISKGSYGYLKVQGYPENIFYFWGYLKQSLIKEGYKIKSPAFEIYNDIFDKNIPRKDQVGEIRYFIEK